MADQNANENPLNLKFSKTFETNPGSIFNALTQPDLIKKWFGPHGYTCPVVEVDLCNGGKYHIEMKPPDGEIIKLNGVYIVINPPHALEFTWLWDEPDAKETRVKVQFSPIGTHTEVVVEQGEFASMESKEGHEQGWLASFDRLEKVFRTKD